MNRRIGNVAAASVLLENMTNQQYEDVLSGLMENSSAGRLLRTPQISNCIEDRMGLGWIRVLIGFTSNSHVMHIICSIESGDH
jgi:hypothetical protein